MLKHFCFIILVIMSLESNSILGQHLFPFSTATKEKSLKLYKNKGQDLFYTTDGTLPNEKSKFFPDTLILKKSTTFTFIVYDNGEWKGPFTQHYIVGHSHHFPIVSITANEKALFDRDTGIYMKGCCADTVSPYFGANFWQDKEIETHVAFFIPDPIKNTHELEIHQGSGLKIFGGYSRSLKQKSFALYARAKYGKGNFKYPFFKNKKHIKSFESLILRNSGSDFNRTQFRDIALSQSAKHLNLDYQEALSTVVYVNGYYWGVMNLREKINEHFLHSNHPQIAPESIDMLKKQNDLKLGSDIDYLALIEYIKNNDLKEAVHFNHVADRIDIDNYINYSIFQIYINNKDAGGNVRYYRSSDWDNKWRWILFDTDFAFGLDNSYSYRQNSLEAFTKDTTITWPHPSWSTFLLRNLLKNNSFKERFANYFCDQLNTNFNTAYIAPIIDSLEESYQSEMPLHFKRWRILSRKFDDQWPEKHMRIWYKNVNVLRHYSKKRSKYMKKHLKQFFDFGFWTPVHFDSIDHAFGKVYINSIPLLQRDYEYLSDLPIQLEAFPFMDYDFKEWSNGSKSKIIKVLPNEAGSIYPIFIPKPYSPHWQKIKFTEIQFKGNTEGSGDWIELSNCSAETLNLKGFAIRDQKDEHHFLIQQDLWLAPYEAIVICEDLNRFKNVYNTKDVKVLGNLDFAFKGYGESVRFYDPSGLLVDYLTDFDNADAYQYQSISLINYHTQKHQIHHWLFTNTPELISPGKINPYMKRILAQEALSAERKSVSTRIIIITLVLIGLFAFAYSLFKYFKSKPLGSV